MNLKTPTENIETQIEIRAYPKGPALTSQPNDPKSKRVCDWREQTEPKLSVPFPSITALPGKTSDTATMQKVSSKRIPNQSCIAGAKNRNRVKPNAAGYKRSCRSQARIAEQQDANATSPVIADELKSIVNAACFSKKTQLERRLRGQEVDKWKASILNLRH